jgi:hypothetical protein
MRCSRVRVVYDYFILVKVGIDPTTSTLPIGRPIFAQTQSRVAIASSVHNVACEDNP